MHFISEKGILHLDLATRNVLLTHPHEVEKISDFGLSKFMSEIEPDEKFASRGDGKNINLNKLGMEIVQENTGECQLPK